MHLPEDYEERPGLTPAVVTAIVAVTLFVAGILIIVFIANYPQKRPANQNQNQVAAVPEETETKDQYPDTDDLITGSTLTPDDLDFWDKYPEDTKDGKISSDGKSSSEETTKEEETVNNPATDGKHTLVEHTDGSEEWLLISPYLPKNQYDFTKLVCESNLMKYYEEGKQTSYVGVDVSKYQDYVDFVKVKKAGIDFVMIRVGARGYGSGQLVLDDYFAENIKRATDAGLDIGVYFFSQAITKEEAVEEANLVLEQIKDYTVDYPVAFDMESIPNDTARIDNLSKSEKTEIAKAYLDTVKTAGYTPMLYGNKEWLLKQVDLSKLTAYDIWLSQQKDVPDYPYKFSMWQYSTTSTVDGIAGYADLNISFIDFSEK